MEKIFSEYEQFKDLDEKIKYLQKYRNIVMHNKRITREEYEESRRTLKSTNKLLVEAINMIEKDIYTETKFIDVVSALENIYSKISANDVSRYKVAPALVAVLEGTMYELNSIRNNFVIKGTSVPGTSVSGAARLVKEYSDRYSSLKNSYKLDCLRPQEFERLADRFRKISNIWENGSEGEIDNNFDENEPENGPEK